MRISIIVSLALLGAACGKDKAPESTDKKPEAKDDKPAPKPADKPEPPRKVVEILGDKLALEFLKYDGGDARFKVTNNSASCTVTELGYSGYAYDKTGKKIGSSGAGKQLDPLAPGKSIEAKFSPSSKYTADLIAEVVITSVKCEDGTNWDDRSRARIDRPMASKP